MEFYILLMDESLNCQITKIQSEKKKDEAKTFDKGRNDFNIYVFAEPYYKKSHEIKPNYGAQ